MSVTSVVEETALVPAADVGSPMPVFRGEQMAQALVAYKELQGALDRAMPDQLMELDGKPFRKKGYWRAVARAFNLSVELVEERRDVYGVLVDSDGVETQNYAWIVTYRASTSSGTSAIGDGACAASEKQRGRMKASEHNVRSHAHTRAMNRAVSNLVGFGEVSAEEVERSEHGSLEGEVVGGPTPHAPRPPAQTPPRKSSGNGTISEAQRRRMYAIAKSAGWSDEDYRAHVKTHGFERDEAVTRDVYEALCTEFEAGVGG
jgi:hypothetical protein